MNHNLKHFLIPHEGNDYHPHFFRELSLGIVSSLAVILFLSSYASHTVMTKTNLGAAVYSSVLVDLTNHDRAANNKNTLTINPLLAQAASLKADDMAAKNYFAHVSPEGLTPWHWFAQAGYLFRYAGENLAVDFTESSDVENAWLASPTHRANLLNDTFTEIGIATKTGMLDGKETTFVVQMFGMPAFAHVNEIAPIKTEPTKTSEPVKTPVPTKTPIKVAVAKPVVKGADAQNTLQVITDTPTLAIVKDTAQTAEPATPIAQKVTPNYSTWYERLFVREPLIVNYIFMSLLALIMIAFTFFIVLEIKHQHPRHIMYGLMVFFIIFGLAAMNHSLVLPLLAFN